MKLIDLGWCMARLEEKTNKLTIVSAASNGDNFYEPAESVVVYGKKGLEALRDALNEAYPPSCPSE